MSLLCWLPDVAGGCINITHRGWTLHDIWLTADTAYSISCGLWQATCHQCAGPASGACVLLQSLHQMMCAAAVTRFCVLCRTTSQMPSGACCWPRRGRLSSLWQSQVRADRLLAQLPSTTPETSQSGRSCAWYCWLALLKLTHCTHDWSQQAAHACSVAAACLPICPACP